MSKAPAFQFYAAEYLADARVQLLSLAQEGIYIRLLCYCWREGSLPGEDAALRMLAKGCRAADLEAVKALFLKSEDGKLRHKRLETEREKQDAFRHRQSQNGAKGGRPKNPTHNPEETQPFDLAKPRKSSAFASSSSSSKEPPSPLVSIMDQANFAARKVFVEAPLSGEKLYMAVEQAARFEISNGVAMEMVADALLESWRYYAASRGKLKITWGAEKFFGEGHWKDKNAWPWKDGAPPRPAKPQRTALDEIREQEERDAAKR